MSKTVRHNPETHEEVQERNYLKRKKKEEQERRRYNRQEEYPDYCTTEENEQAD